MAQTTSRPALYIPEPIEQQLRVYELGTLLGVYKRGWIGHHNRRPKFRILLWNLVMLTIVIVSSIIIFYSIQSTGILILGLAFIPFFALWGLVIGVPALLQASLCIGAFSNGLVYAKNTQVTVLAWSDIERFEQKTIRGMTGTLHFFSIHAHDGRVFRGKDRYVQVDSLGKIIRKHIVEP